jgi:hypothetical protein
MIFSASSLENKERRRIVGMKTKHCLCIMIGIFLCGMANAAELKQAATTDAWRTSLDEFVKEVIAIAQKSEITDAPVAITRIREYTVFTNDKNEKIWVVFKQSFGKEFHGELVKQFSGQVSWRGVVDSVETDTKEKVHIIKVKFPVPNELPKGITFSDWFRLSILISKLDAAKLPTKGSEFAFRGKLMKEKADALFEPVNVLYGLGPNAGKTVVGVDLVDVEPSDGK